MNQGNTWKESFGGPRGAEVNTGQRGFSPSSPPLWRDTAHCEAEEKTGLHKAEPLSPQIQGSLGRPHALPPKGPAGSHTACAVNERGREETSVSVEKNDTGNVGLALCGGHCRLLLRSRDAKLGLDPPCQRQHPCHHRSANPACASWESLFVFHSVRRDWLKSRKATQRSGAPLKQLHTDPKCGMPGIVEPRRSFSSPVGPR